jgi:hypothetical protein
MDGYTVALCVKKTINDNRKTNFLMILSGLNIKWVLKNGRKIKIQLRLLVNRYLKNSR